MSNKIFTNTFLAEVAWEVCNQVGGIYTVIRSKIPAMMDKWGDDYLAIGPYYQGKAAAEFEPIETYDDAVGQAVLEFRKMGFEIHYGCWLVSGRPRVVLLNPFSVYYKLSEIKYVLWERHDITCDHADDLQSQVIAFGYLVKEFLSVLSRSNPQTKFVGHFHEWMVGTPIMDIKFENAPIATVFTTHATLLGRYLAMNDSNFYDNLPHYYWAKEAHHFNIETAVRIERGAAHGAEVFTTVSEVTARECESLLGRKPDLVLPNGLNIQRFIAQHEHQNLHKEYKDKIHHFIMGHFFNSYSFDLDKTIYFFTSGRFEYRNKGFDLTVEALARLNYRMQRDKIDATVVMIFVTKQPFYSINPDVLHSHAMMEEIRDNCKAIEQQLGERLFMSAISSHDHKIPDLNNFIDDYWRLRLRRTQQSWKSWNLPKMVTHNLVHSDTDELLNYLRLTNLINNASDKVKVVYHPDFISPSSPLFGMEYGQFVRGCHLGVFPSYYEPWGYTPLEAMASGVPSVTSDLAGFGDYVLENIPNPEEKGIYVINRYHKGFSESADQLADILYTFVNQSRRERIIQRNKVEGSSEHFDWGKLTVQYDKAHQLAIDRKFS